jgi:hypothetical protein
VDLLEANGVQSQVELRPNESRTFELYHSYLLCRNMFVHATNTARKFFIRNVYRLNMSRPSTSIPTKLPSQTNSFPLPEGGQNTSQSTNIVPNIGYQPSSVSGSIQTTTTQHQHPLKRSHNDNMLLCADEQGWLTTWEDLDVSQIKSDKELFGSFQKQITRRKSRIHRFASLRTIQRISFVKVSYSLHLRHDASIINEARS